MNPIRLRGPGDILATLPYQLGYQPDDAVVVVALRDRAVGLTQRLDLPPPERVPEAVDAMLPPLLREEPDDVLLVGYEESEGDAMPVLDALRDACRGSGINVLDRLVVRHGRFYAPDCHDGCCTPEGTLLPAAADTPAVADFVGLEVSPLPRRESLDDLVARDEPTSAEVARALRGLGPAWPGQALGALPADGEPDRARAVRRLSWLSLWRVVCDASASRPPLEGLAADELAQLALSMADIELRDALIGWICPGALPLDLLDEDLLDQLRTSLPEPAWAAGPTTSGSVVAGRRMQSRLAYLCRAVPDAHAPALLTLFASFAWWQGNGAMARSALTRALEIAPDYRLALLLERMVDLAIRPRASA